MLCTRCGKRPAVVFVSNNNSKDAPTAGYCLTCAKELGINCYSREILRMASEESGINERLFGMSDEKMKGADWFKILSRPYDGELLPPEDKDFVSEENIFNYQAKIIKDLAEKESCVIVGRCADYVLGDYSNVINTFIYAYKDDRLNRIMDIYKLTEKQAADKIKKTDRERKLYYEARTGREWGGIESNSMLFNTSLLGIDGVTDALEAIYRKWESRG